MKLRTLLIGLTLAVGCNRLDPLRVDHYMLNSIAGVSLPAPYTPSSASSKVAFDELAFYEDGTGTRQTLYEGSSGAAATQSFSFTRVGNHVEVTFACPPGADCMAAPHLVGTFSSTGLTIETAVGALVPLVYTRVMPID
jgi:hypothetical protein